MKERTGSSIRWMAAVILPMILLTASCARKGMSPFSERAPQGYLERGGGGGGASYRVASNAPLMAMLISDQKELPHGDRKIVRNGSLDLLVDEVGKGAATIRAVTERAGGFVEKSTLSNSGSRTASLRLRVPTERLDQVMGDIKLSATKVERETIEARDVTREYIDLDARLRNVQAEEQQYLQIMKRATTLKDTLDVSEKLSDVRGRIEELQGQMKYLTTQIEMSSLDVSLRAEAEAKVLGIRWKPLRQAKIALADMVSGLADWADSVIAFFINLPLILVWVGSVVLLIAVAWRVVRFLWRKLGPKTNWRLRWVPKSPPETPPSPDPRPSG